MTDATPGGRERVSRWLRARGDSKGDLAARVAALEEEMVEAHRLNRRLAELMDVVEELLVPLSERDEERVRAYLDSHSSPL